MPPLAALALAVVTFLAGAGLAVAFLWHKLDARRKADRSVLDNFTPEQVEIIRYLVSESSKETEDETSTLSSMELKSVSMSSTLRDMQSILRKIKRDTT